MSGPRTPRTASARRLSELDVLRRAITIRDEWLDYGLSTDPADRPAAEAAITGLYRLAGASPPRFTWVESPGAVGAGPGWPPLRGASMPDDLPLLCRLASAMSSLRHRLTRHCGIPEPGWAGPAPVDDPEEELLAGTPLRRILDRVVGLPLETTLADNVRKPMARVRAVQDAAWYGQHDAHWAGHFDAWRRTGMARFDADDDRQLDLWADVARTCGWWWPSDGHCVVAERPAVVRTEPLPGGRNGERRLHDPRGPAVAYVDGWGVHVWNGTVVPEWVITGPTVELIAAEPNIEVRRCAIEHIGWDAYVDQAGLALVAAAPDPGNPGCELRLYDQPFPHWPVRVLLAVNGSVERDGHRRRYGLSVPAAIDDPVAAGGWSYGLSGAQYSQLIRRT